MEFTFESTSIQTTTKWNVCLKPVISESKICVLHRYSQSSVWQVFTYEAAIIMKA